MVKAPDFGLNTLEIGSSNLPWVDIISTSPIGLDAIFSFFADLILIPLVF
jgi:hypothetical protein